MAGIQAPMCRVALLVVVAVVFTACDRSWSTSSGPPRCQLFSGTADALAKSEAVDGSRKSLSEAIAQWKDRNRRSGRVSQSADKPTPHPYWRREVSEALLLLPEVVTSEAYTLCWRGVVSPVICTSGAKLCW